MTNLSQSATNGSDDNSNNNNNTPPIAIAPAIGVADMSQQQQQQQHHSGGGDSIINTIVGVSGNILEWYDFALFGFFSDVIAEVFFPPEPAGSDANLMKTFVIFGSAFLMRPIGGLIIGYIGDKHGRKEALTKSLFLMAIPTTLMGCLPTYEQVGVLSTILLCVCRLVQGISVGGQLPASLVYTVEKRPKSQWGYYGSLPMVAANVGTLLGNICGAMMRSILTEEQLVTWGWRIPFFSGILIAFVSCYLRKYGTDSGYNSSEYNSGRDNTTQQGQAQQEAQQVQQEEDPRVHTKPHNPIKVAFRRENRLALLSTSIVPMLWASGFYVSFVWIAIYMEELMDPPIKNAFWINSMSLLLGMTFVLPIAGHISDKIGSRIGMMTVSGLLLTGLGPVCLIAISKGNPVTAFFSQLLLGVLLSFYGGPLCAWLVENFSPEVRMTSASIGYDISHAIAGGFSPAIATALYTNFGINATGLVYVVFGSVSVAGLYINYCFGQGDKESDTATSTSSSLSPEDDSSKSVVEMQQTATPTNTTSSSSSLSSSSSTTTTTTKQSDKTSFKNIV